MSSYIKDDTKQASAEQASKEVQFVLQHPSHSAFILK